MNKVIDVDTAVFDLADALGADFVYLKPPGTCQRDPATVAVMLAAWLLRAVADGITEGARKTTVPTRPTNTIRPTNTTRPTDTTGPADPTATIAHAVTLLVRKYVTCAFLAGANRSALAGQCAALRDSVATAARASADLAADLARQLPAALGAAMRDALCAAGLPADPARRVEQAVHAQVALLVRPTGRDGRDGQDGRRVRWSAGPR